MKAKSILIFFILILFGVFSLAGCTMPGPEKNAAPPEELVEISPPDVDVVPEGLLGPENLVYVGAFRLPDGREEYDWAWGGAALTFYPDGDPGGPDDGFSGSLYAVGDQVLFIIRHRMLLRCGRFPKKEFGSFRHPVGRSISHQSRHHIPVLFDRQSF